MTIDIEQVAANWITFAQYEADKVPDVVFANGWILYELVQDDPRAAWEAIKQVIQCYPEADFYAPRKTEAQQVVGNLAAGPLEDLLSAHGPLFIEQAESEARADRRMAWTLGGVWQCGMSDDIWKRVRQASDDTYWLRPAD